MGEVVESVSKDTQSYCPSARRQKCCRAAWSKEYLVCLLTTLLVTDVEALRNLTVVVADSSCRLGMVYTLQCPGQHFSPLTHDAGPHGEGAVDWETLNYT